MKLAVVIPISDLYARYWPRAWGELAGQIKANALAAPRADLVVIPSTAETSPLRAHNFIGNERLVAEKTVQWLQGVGLAAGAKR